MASPFLDISQSEWIASNALAFAIRDKFPVSPGHALVITRRPCETYWDATEEERAAIWELVLDVKRRLEAELSPRPAGFNVGFNAGEAAGQTVLHLHVHVIPRYRGDVPDPRGGVRGVIPSKQSYPLDGTGQ
jgi:diadenosine tetraphosphate (Ap4A) HIT family hydrolase